MYACNLLLSLNIIAKLGKELQSTRSSLQTTVTSSGVPRATLTFDNLLKHSLNTLRASILTFIACYRERVQIKVNQGKRCIQQSPGNYHTWIFRFSSPCGIMDSFTYLATVCDRCMEYYLPGELTQALVSEFLLGLHGWLPIWLTSSLQLLWK